MLRSILPVFLLNAVAVSSSNFTATQSDWSGGPDQYGPVLQWGSDFYHDTDVIWTNPGSVYLGYGSRYSVDSSFDDASSIHSSDIDGDGDQDLVAMAYYDGIINWWENLDGVGESWIEHSICQYCDICKCITSADLDSDGDMDVLAVSYQDQKVVWCENLDGSGYSWHMHIIKSGGNSPNRIIVSDIDMDGYPDVVVMNGHDVSWWRNDDGSASSWTHYPIDTDIDYGSGLAVIDMDGDEDLDVAGSMQWISAVDLGWWENEDGAGTSWTLHDIERDIAGIYEIVASDLDCDGDFDMLGASESYGILLWMNIDGSGTSWYRDTLDGEFDYAVSFLIWDMDGDSDLDVLSASALFSQLAWWENVDGTADTWVKHVYTSQYNGVQSITGDFINDDDILDVAGTSWYPGEISWWMLDGHAFCGAIESSTLDADCEPIWDSLEWTAAEPPGSSICFQVRTSAVAHPCSMGLWSDTLLTSPANLSEITGDGERYFQYRAILNTTDPYTTPVLEEVTVNWLMMGLETETPYDFELLPMIPNPSGVPPAIRFILPEPTEVTISIYDTSGRLVLIYTGEEYAAGLSSIRLNELRSGLYLCRIETPDHRESVKFTIID